MGIAHAAFEVDLAGADAREEDAADVLHVSVGCIQRQLRVVEPVAVPAGRRYVAGLVVEQQTAAVGQLVDAIGPQIQLQVADVDVVEALLARFNREGLAASLQRKPVANANHQPALLRCEAGLLPGIAARSIELRLHRGIDVRFQDARQLFCSNGGDKIVAAADRKRIGRRKQALHDGMEQLAFLRWADAPLTFVERLGSETLRGEGLERTGGLAF